MKIRIAIVDDREDDREVLKESSERFFASKNKYEIEVSTYASGEELLKGFEPGDIHIAFLDICMDEMTGIELAKKLRDLDQNLLIVFQTTSRDYAFDAFPLHPFDYLIKPCQDDQVASVYDEALKVIRTGDPDIKVISVKGTFSVPLRSIIAIQSHGHNVEFLLTNSQSLTSTETFHKIQTKLASDNRFLLINRGVLVNMDHVLAPREGEMEMKDGSTLPIRVNGRTQVLSDFSQYMISRME